MPTIGSLLGGPIGSVAATAVADCLGLSDKSKESVQKILSSGNLTADQIASLQQADIALKAKMAELGIKAEEIAAADRDSARKMQMTTGSLVPAVLSSTITIGFFGILIFLMTGDLKLWDNAGLQMLLGSLGTSWGMVVSFYFGSSHSVQPTGKNDL